MKLYKLNERLMNNNMDRIHEMHELDEVLIDKTPTAIVLMTKDDFNLNDSYFKFDGYGNLESYSELKELIELYDDIQ